MSSSVTRCFVVVVLLASSLAVDSSAQERRGTRIIGVETDRLSNDLIVKVSGRGTVWVGLTIDPGREIDLAPVRIWPEHPGIAIARFSGIELAAHLADRVPQEGFDYVVTLWRERISPRNCRRPFGRGSERCAPAERSGFRMEGRLDEWEGRYP